MGMRIGGASQAWASQQSSSAVNWQQRHQNFKSLKSALQNNDLAGAQQAFAALSANNPQALANANGPLAQLGQALQAGNMPAAQQVAQNWQNNQQNKAGNTPSAGADAALASFLQTLNNSQDPASPTPGTTANAGSATESAPAATSPQQVAQALLAFEKNLFDSLQLQNKSQNATSTPGPTSGTASDSNPPSVTTSIAQPTVNNATGQTQHHHHHHGGGSSLNSELNALIAQNSQSSNAASSGNSANGLDQSFKSLLSTLGVSGNNASLNSFLQAMSSNMQSSQAQA